MSRAVALDVLTCPLDGVQLIEASAGTGKTWNICNLYLRLILEKGLEVQQILVVTFTKAATAELQDRIRGRLSDALSQALDQGSSADAARLQRAIRHFDEAAVFTIHGFCKRALDDTPVAAGMPLRQDLVEDDGDLRQEAANDFWRRHVAGADLPASFAAWLIEQRDTPARFAELLRRHGGKTMARVLWPEGSDGPFTPPDDTAFAAAHAHARALWHADHGRIARCVHDSIESLHKGSYKVDAIDKAVAQWDRVLASEDAHACVPTEDKLKLLGRATYKAKKGAPPCVEHAFFDAAQALLDEWASLRASLEAARWQLLRRFVETVPAELRQRKRERRVVAFDDMLFNLHERLEGAAGDSLSAALRARFPAALIDEFQDTDPLQFAIFDKIYGMGGTLFLVGDPKQAIYSFRNADLHTYLGAARRAQRQYTLAQNQRSSPALIAALNAVFAANGAAFMLEGLNYEAVTPGEKERKPFLDRTLPRGALHLWSLPLEEGRPTKKEAQRAATNACASEVARLLGAAQRGEVLHDGRPLQAGEIAVLVRSHREGSEIRRALAQLGVGSVELAQTSIFETTDAEEIERILLAIVEPARERRIRAALATELLGFDAAAIDALSRDEAAMGAMRERFSAYRDDWTDRGVGPMLRQLAVQEDVAARMLARTDGERRLTNLRHLSECLHDAARDHPGPEALVRWFKRQRQDNRGEAFQVRLESDRNLVQIVTIHKSKGLEYPVVFCPFLFDGYNRGGSRELPMGREYHDDEGRSVIDYRELESPELDDVKARQEIERDAERLRLIYVALTRAVHRCYLVVGGYFVEAFGSPSSSESGCNPLNWLVTGEGMTPQAWRKSRTPPSLVHAAWSQLAASHPAAMAIEPLPTAPGERVRLPQPAAESLAALAPPERIARGWQLASYSSLAHGARNEQAAADHDARAEQDDVPRTAPADLPADDILRFPRGARAGDTLHAVLESVDFQDPSGWPAAIASALRAKPPGGSDDVPAGAMLAQLVQLVRDVLDTELARGVVLSKTEHRIAELGFSLTAPALVLARLAALLQRFGYPATGLGEGFLGGYLRGFIDLVFESGGRFWILDWKSTHLGWRAEDYSQDRMARAMTRQGYHLQYLLYALALHRWLRARLAGYDYDTHVGGVLYLFVRGVRPQWRLADGSPAGVFHDRPPRELIEAMDAAFGEAAREAA